MNKEWPTKEKDMHAAQLIMEEYAREQNSDSLGLLELVVDTEEKKLDFRIANWVIAIAYHFNTLYGANQGDFVTRQVITKCITQGHVIH
ncbi:hypothetical protein [Legionella adelaidensis]|uniref:hypothetical protein n=1 Tax=Legionella adelaidensis TaxID=45056 RepID=UPI000730F24C|nr:hypothetical protein [Legionella adelaidensis]